jgi:polysaccharide export outer membrane protein
MNRTFSKITFASVLSATVFAFDVAAQFMPGAPASQAPAAQGPIATPTQVSAPPPAAPTGPERRPDYVLGPDDVIIIRAFQAEELSDKPVQITGQGYINLPMIGQIQAGGLTVAQLESSIAHELEKFVKQPQVTIMVSDYRSQPVSVMGAVRSPGVVQLRGAKNIVEVISLAGGLSPDAGNTLTVTREIKRGKLPLSTVSEDPSQHYTVARINLQKVMTGQTPQDNIMIQADDVLTVPRAQMVYVIGEVQRPGGYVLTDRESISLLQVLSLAGGMKPTASPKKAKVLRDEEGKSGRTEIANNVKKILDGDAPDIQLHAEDILFVPNNIPKQAGLRALESAVNIGTGMAIWRF